MEARPAADASAGRRWLDIDSSSDEDLAAFLGIGRTDRVGSETPPDADKLTFGSGAYKRWYRDAGPEGRLDAPAPFDQGLAEQLPEWRKGGKTEGLLNRTDTGDSLCGDKPLKSGFDGPAKLFEARELGLESTWVNISHVETHAAATMRARSDETSEAVLYLNRRPCDGPKGCYGNMERMLPDGAKVTAYWPGGWDVFIGKPDEEGQM